MAERRPIYLRRRRFETSAPPIAVVGFAHWGAVRPREQQPDRLTAARPPRIEILEQRLEQADLARRVRLRVRQQLAANVLAADVDRPRADVIEHRPTRAMVRLSRAAVAALGTGAYALSSANIWTVAHQSSWVRLVAVGLLSLVLILVALVVRHGLWERAREQAARERVVLFNIVTLTTLAIGVVTLYVALFVLMAVAAAVIIPPVALERQHGEPATVEEFLRLAWLATSVATVGGAFGSLLESHEAIRYATYRPQAGGEVSP